MAEPLPTHAEILAALRPERLPPGFDALTVSDALALLALALVVGCGLSLLLDGLTRPVPSHAAQAASALEAARGLPGAERLMIQCRLLDRIAASLKPSRSHRLAWLRPGARATDNAVIAKIAALQATIGDELYRPKPKLDCDALDSEILMLARESASPAVLRRRAGG